MPAPREIVEAAGARSPRTARSAPTRRLPDRAQRPRLEHHDRRAPTAVEPGLRLGVVEHEGRAAALRRSQPALAAVLTDSDDRWHSLRASLHRRPTSRRYSTRSRTTAPASSGASRQLTRHIGVAIDEVRPRGWESAVAVRRRVPGKERRASRSQPAAPMYVLPTCGRCSGSGCCEPCTSCRPSGTWRPYARCSCQPTCHGDRP